MRSQVRLRRRAARGQGHTLGAFQILAAPDTRLPQHAALIPGRGSFETLEICRKARSRWNRAGAIYVQVRVTQLCRRVWESDRRACDETVPYGPVAQFTLRLAGEPVTTAEQHNSTKLTCLLRILSTSWTFDGMDCSFPIDDRTRRIDAIYWGAGGGPLLSMVTGRM